MPDSVPRKSRFFLSHSMKDHDVVELLRRHIEALGVELYLAEHDPQPGRPLDDKVVNAIHNCDAMVVLLTANGAVAPFVQQEIGVARGARKLIVPIVQHGIDAGTLAMLAGVERIEVDFGDLSEALTTVHAKLGPFVQTESKRLAAAATAGTPATAQPSPLVLAGLGLLVLALFLVFSRS